MSQLSTGTVDVTNGDATVVGHDTNWSTIVPGDVFILKSDNVSYQIASVTPPGSSVSGLWELELTAPYAGDTVTGVNYAISIDFSPLYQFLLVAPGDIRTDLIQRRNIALLETILDNLGTGGGGGTGFVKVVIVEIAGDLIGADTIPVEYLTALTELPQHIFRPTFEKTDANETNVDAVTVDSVTLTGFNVNLSGGAVAGHKLRCAYIP